MRVEPTNTYTSKYKLKKTKPEHKNTATVFICEKCGELYDYYINYPKGTYSVPRYGKQIKGFCHKCRMGNANYTPRKGSNTEIMLKTMLKDNLTISIDDWEKYGYASRGCFSSSLSKLRHQNVLNGKKVKGFTHYSLTNEYKAKLSKELL